MQPEGDEDAWRAIVENYGDRVELDAEARPESVAEAAEPSAETPADSSAETPVDDEDRFVPPVPPPLPSVPPDRFVAWLGLFGSPAVLLLCLVFTVSLPPWLGYLLVAGFIGGFVYLVVTMQRGPADPWDDGARL